MLALKRLVTVVLLLFVGVTVGTLIAQEVGRPPEDAIETSPSVGAAVTVESSPEAPAVSVLDAAEASLGSPGMAEGGEHAEPQDAAVSVEEAALAATCVVDAIYFHNTHRCWTCQKIERNAKEVVELAYAAELAEGRLRWSAVNMEVERRYVEQYDLTKPTLILVRHTGDEPDEWRALEETWTFVRNEARFASYIEEAVGTYLGGCR